MSVKQEQLKKYVPLPAANYMSLYLSTVDRNEGWASSMQQPERPQWKNRLLKLTLKKQRVEIPHKNINRLRTSQGWLVRSLDGLQVCSISTRERRLRCICTICQNLRSSSTFFGFLLSFTFLLVTVISFVQQSLFGSQDWDFSDSFSNFLHGRVDIRNRFDVFS